jgi:hypothetical protein
MCRRDRSPGGRQTQKARALARGHHAAVVPDKRRHGLDDDAETRALLRSLPTREALTWVADCVGSDVVEWNVLRGGTSSAMYALTVGDQARTDIVLRCYLRADLNEEEPTLAEREAAALRVMAAADVPTPRLVAVDGRGERVGVLAVLMTRLPSRVVWDRDLSTGGCVVSLLSSLRCTTPPWASTAPWASTPTTSSCRTSRRGGLRRRRCGSELWRCSMARSSKTTARSSTATTAQATCCGTGPM